MNPWYYKYCMVPQCKSTSIKTPNKLFIFVPSKVEVRKKWLTLARRNDANCLSSISRMYFCEDHFDLPNDMENYMEYHVMGSVSQVRMKPGCMPHKFICQPDRKTRTSNTTERPYLAKKRKMMILEECKKEFEEKIIVTEQSSFEEIASGSSVSTQEAAARHTQPALEDSLFNIKQEVCVDNETITEIIRLTDIDISNSGHVTVKVERITEYDDLIDTGRSLTCDNQQVIVEEEIITEAYDSIEEIPMLDIKEQVVLKTEPTEDSGSIDIHESTIEEDIQRHCNACKEEIIDDDKLDEKSLSHENNNPFSTVIKTYTCNVCDWKFTRNNELKTHLRIHTADKPYSCDKCDMKFGFNLNLENHKMMVHCKPKSHQCDRCDMTFTTKWNLSDHLRTHTGEKPYACRSCNKSFRTTGTLRKHARVHTREKPYKCDCGKSYTQKSSLVQHQVSHTGDRPYVCHICSKSFNRSSVLLKHKKTHEVVKPQHACNRCDITFKSASLLKKHMQTHSRG